MNCPEVKRVIYRYLDGELSSQEERAFFSHLAHCSGCQGDLQRARQTHRLLENSLTQVEPPPDLTQRVMEKIAQLDPPWAQQAAGSVTGLAKKEKKLPWFLVIQNGGARLARVASFVVLLAATGALLLSNATPHLPKISFNRDTGTAPVVDSPVEQVRDLPPSGKSPKDLPVTEIRGEEQTGGESTPGEVEKTTQEKGLGAEPKQGEKRDGLSGQQKGKTASPSGTGEDKPNSPEPENPGEKAQQTPSQEEGTNPLPRLNGPIMAATKTEVNSVRTLPITPVVVDEYSNIMPEWTAEEKRITYLSTKGTGEGSYSLWSLELASNTARLISSNVKADTKPPKPSLQSPDGKKVIEVAEGQVWVRPVGAGEKEAITPKLDAQRIVAAWAPDGKKIAISVKSQDSAQRGLWLAEDTGAGWELTLGTRFGGGEVLSWSPDGQKLAFTDGQNTIYLLRLGSQGAKPVLYQVVPRGDNLGAMSLSWSRDSGKLLFDWAKPDSNQRGIYLVQITD